MFCFFIVVQVPLQLINQNAGNGEGEGNAGGAEDEDQQGNNEVVEPRVDIGPLPTIYPLPTFPADIRRKIEILGRRIDASTKKDILNILRKDMMRYSCYV